VTGDLTTRRFVIVALLLFTLLTCVMTFPQVLHLRDAVHDDGDPLLNAWALAWVAHQLPRAPAHLFDANIFYPERRTLAYSETLLLPSVAAAPLRWIGVGPVLVYNLVFLSGFVISGVGVALLVRELTGAAGPALLAGLVFAFLPFRIDHYAHMQLQQTQCLPFAMWAFHRLLDTRRVRDGALFGAFVAGQMLSCMYYGLLLIPYFAVVCVALAVARRARIVPLIVAAAVVLVAAIPVGKAYLGARKVVGERGRDEIVQGSATLTDYLGPPEENLLYGKALARFSRSERRLFPGFVAIAIAAIGLGTLGTRGTPGTSRAVVLAYALGLLVAFDISLGFNGFSYRVLYEYFLPFRGLRIPARNGLIAGFSLAVLAGLGAARIRRGEAIAALGVLICVEYLSRPIPMMAIPSTPPLAYADAIRDNMGNPTAAFFEFPVSSHDDPTYMYFSTFHWQHLVNGYSGFFPPSYIFLVNAVENIPDDASLHAIKSHGARYLFVHGERLFGARYEELTAELDRRRELTLVSRTPAEREGQHGEISVYRISYAEAR
jgi:hypothetical protein